MKSSRDANPLGYECVMKMAKTCIFSRKYVPENLKNTISWLKCTTEQSKGISMGGGIFADTRLQEGLIESIQEKNYQIPFLPDMTKKCNSLKFMCMFMISQQKCERNV